MVIIIGEITKEVRSELTKQLLLISGKIGCYNKRPLEVTIINLKDITLCNFPLKYEYQFGEWLRDEIESGAIPQVGYDSDLTILLWQARKYSFSLKGPELKEIIKSISKKDVQKAIKYSLPKLIAGVRGDERNVLLTLARMWFTISTGKISTKDAAAEWAILRLPPKFGLLLKAARKAYLGKYEDCWNSLDTELTSTITFIEQAIKNCTIE